MGKGVIVLLALLLLPFVTGAGYSTPKADVTLDVRPDGIIDLSEIITYSFSGTHDSAFLDMQKGQWNAYDFVVLDGAMPLRTQVLDTRDAIRIKWFFSAQDEQRTFTVKYKISKAVNLYTDVAELSWMVWAGGKLGLLTGRITLPEPSSEVYYWGHPSLNGKIGMLDNKSVVFEAHDTAAEADVRIAFPASMMLRSSEVNLFNSAGLQKILDEEAPARPINPANAFSIFSLTPLFIILLVLAVLLVRIGYVSARMVIGLLVLFAVYFYMAIAGAVPLIEALLVLIWFVLCYWLFSREPKADFKGRYEQEPPYKYSPGIVSSLMNTQPGDDCLLAEILYLATKGYFKIEKAVHSSSGVFGRGDDYGIKLERKFFGEHAGLSASHRKVLAIVKWLAGTAKSIPMSLLAEKALASPIIFKEKLSAWKCEVKKESVEFFDESRGMVSFMLFYLGLLGLHFFTGMSWLGFAAAVITGVLLLAIFPGALGRLSPKGALHHMRWMHHKAFLKDFSALGSVQPESIGLWEEYLIYSIPLGVSSQVQKVFSRVYENYHKPVRGNVFVHGLLGSSLSTFRIKA